MLNPLHNWLSRQAGKYRQRAAQKRLAEIVAQTAESYEVRRYRERRDAAKKGIARRVEAQG